MKVYYLKTDIPGRTGEKAVVAAFYDTQDFWFDRTSLTTYNVLNIDEVAPGNTKLCADIFNTVSLRNSVGLGKYYVSSGILYKRDNWTPRRL